MSSLTSARLVREFPARYRFEGATCRTCGAVIFPARLVCPHCGSRNFEPRTLQREGTVATFTVIHVATTAFRQETPYILAVIDLADGARCTCQLVDVDPAQVRIGMPVRLEFRRIQEAGEAGVIAYGHKAVPA
jgi:uncharacterized OB-fold protein